VTATSFDAERAYDDERGGVGYFARERVDDPEARPGELQSSGLMS
jgi:hypothetical protein